MANEAEKKILIDVLVESTQAIKNLATLVDETEQLRLEQKKLDTSTTEGRQKFEQLGTQIRANNVEIRQMRKELDNSVKGMTEQEGSLNSLSASLSNMKAEYRALSEADRNSDVGVALRNSILATNTALQQAENAYGDYYRTVGQYEKFSKPVQAEITKLNEDLKSLSTQFLTMTEEEKQSEFGQAIIAQMNGISNQITNTQASYTELVNTQQDYQNQMTGLIAGNNQLIGSFLQTATSGEGVAGVFKMMKTQVVALGKSFLALLANPIVAAFAAIVAVLALLGKAMQRNEDNATKLNGIMAKLGAVFSWLLDKLEPVATFLVDGLVFAFDLLMKQVDKTIDAIVKVLNFLKLDSAAQWVQSVTDSVKDMTKAAGDLVNMEASLVKQQREWKKETAALQIEEEGLRAKIDDTTLSVKERMRANEELSKNLKRQNEIAIAEATEALRIAETRLKIEGQTAELLNAVAEASIKKSQAEAQAAKLDGETVKKANEIRKESADKAYDLMQKTLSNKKALDESLIKAEAGYQSQDFNIKQAYAKRLNDLNVQSQQQQLKLQRQNGKITQAEYDSQMQAILNQQTEFSNTQISELNSYFKQQRQELLSMVQQSESEQIEAIKEKYKKAVDSMAKMQKPIQLVGQSDADYQKELSNYSAFMYKQAELSNRLNKQMQSEIDEVNENSIQRRMDEIIKASDKEYKNDLAKYTDNERLKTAVSIEQLEKQIKAKKDANLSTYEDEARLRALQSQTNQINLNSDLIKANENAKAKYEARKAYLLKEAAIYKDNADKQLEIAQQLSQNEKELFASRVAEMEKYADAAYSLLNSLMEFSNANDDAELQRYEEENESKKAILEQRLNSGVISQANYDSQVAALDKALEKKQAEIARKQAERAKAMQVFQIAINTASAIMNQLATTAFPAAFPLVALISALGAAQLATVAATPLPKAAKGMYVQGASHAGGGVPIEAEGGEVIMTKKATQMYLPILSAMNVAGGGVPFTTPFSDGGYSMRSNSGNNEGLVNAIMDAVVGGMGSVKIVTAIEDIRRADSDYQKTIDMFDY